MSLIGEMVKESLPIWQQCLDTPFVQGVALGTLPEECFEGYIVEDSLYLREYAKIFAWGMIQSGDMAEIRAYYSLLAFVSEEEDVTRRHYLQRYRLDDARIQSLPLRPQNRAYVDTMIDAARGGQGAAECMAACLPCMLSYEWIFSRVIQEHPGVKDTPYWPFVRDYADGGYEQVCREWVDFAEKACASISPERRRHCASVFHACSEHELHFWEMCAQPRRDLELCRIK